MSTTDRNQTRLLNGQLLQNLRGGGAIITPGIAAMGAEAVERLVRTIAVFDDFCNVNDPHGEHDFGAFEFEGNSVIFKIDYYDKSKTSHSPNPADASVTERIITIMKADEY